MRPTQRQGSQALLNRYFQAVREVRLYSSPGNLRFYLSYLFGDLRFANKRMLDIGGGTGLFSFYAACMGASEVICLEPEADGFLGSLSGKFGKVKARLPELDHVHLEAMGFQDFDAGGKEFDILLLHNSVNHLDEASCERLHRDPEAVRAYDELFRKMSGMARAGARLVIADCSSRNLFPLMNLRNPVARDIEWHKHQPPELWIQLLRRAGFHKPDLRWRSFDQLRWVGKWLTGNRVAAYLLQSHFRLILEKRS